MSVSTVLFIVSQSFEIFTHEDLERGDASQRGFDFEDEAYTAEELRDYLKREGFAYPSSSPLTGHRDWISTPTIEDSAYFEKGEHRTLSLHVSSVRDHEGKALDEQTAGALWVRLLGSHLQQHNEPSLSLSA